MSSIGGRVGGTPGLGAYQASKFAVEGFSEVLSNEVRPFGVRVIIVEPGAFRTPIWSMARPPVGADYEESVGATNRHWDSVRGAEAGDPARAAQIIVDVVKLDDPPLRLLPRCPRGHVREGRVRSSAPQKPSSWADVSRSRRLPRASVVTTGGSSRHRRGGRAARGAGTAVPGAGSGTAGAGGRWPVARARAPAGTSAGWSARIVSGISPGVNPVRCARAAPRGRVRALRSPRAAPRPGRSRPTATRGTRRASPCRSS